MSAQKQHEATQSRRERARHEGNVPRSSELTGWASFAFGISATFAILPLLRAQWLGLLSMSIATPERVHVERTVGILGVAVVPLIAAALGGTLASVAQAGGLRWRALEINFARVFALRGFARLASGEAPLAALRASVAFALAGAVAWPQWMRLIMSASARRPTDDIAAIALETLRSVAWSVCAVAGAFALTDYALARRRWLASLRMTADELRRDVRETDGDPQTKSTRRRLHRQLGRSGLRRVREASFVVVNPTHVAVALRYAPPAVPVPEIVTRALDDVALRVRAIASGARIPIVEDAALARWLYRAGTTGQPIPPETFVAVAETIAGLLRMGVLAQ
jgi:flagellar biosynthesis protein FlhB